MRLHDGELRDALCAEFAVGLLRGRARRRFARMLEGDADLRRRLAGWEAMMPTERGDVPLPKPAQAVWCGIRRELGLPGRWREQLDRIGLARVWAALATAALALVLGLQLLAPGGPAAPAARLAMLTAPDGDFIAWVRVDVDKGILDVALKEALAAPAGKTYEFWFIAAAAKTPTSLGTNAALGGSAALRPDRRALLAGAGTLAISLEPNGGSPTGQPTGPVLLTAKLPQS